MEAVISNAKGLSRISTSQGEKANAGTRGRANKGEDTSIRKEYWDISKKSLQSAKGGLPFMGERGLSIALIRLARRPFGLGDTCGKGKNCQPEEKEGG